MVRWRGLPTSRNVRDVRGKGVAVGGGLGCFGILAILGISMLTGADPLALFDAFGGGQATVAPAPGDAGGAPPDELGQFASVVLRDLEETWQELMPQGYRDPTLYLFRDRFPSACGMGVAAMGPFYCPADQSIYLDFSFFDQLANQFGAPGDFAQAYVIAHEFGHHVQNLLGISGQVQAMRRNQSRAEANTASVRLELMADCLAGVWGHYAGRRGLLEPGDVEEGLSAAAAIGDDRLQRQSGRAVVPESFTHGSSEQRMQWLRRGLESGDPNACETFG